MQNVGIIGLGSVGYAVIHGLSQYYSYAGYDLLNSFSWEPILETEIVFICVGTPMNEKGRLDCTNVEQVLERLHMDCYSGVVVVKSTISIGFMDSMAKKFPGLRLVYMPEFLREKNSFSWFVNPDRIVAAGQSDDVAEALSYFTWVKGAEIITTDFKSAEFAKLAHNTYIAAKVSFTNEMERNCRAVGANPMDVMKTVWTDRRVQCSSHLTPGLGPYGGKCVVKDMNELTNSTNSEFLSAVRTVNDRCEVKETTISYPPVAVIIPTMNRPDKLRQALNSIASQTYAPMLVIVVNDPGAEATEMTGKIVSEFAGKLPVRQVVNSRAANVSGAINTGLKVICDSGWDLNELFIALLDDDDWWDRKYLENCVKFACEEDIDWVITGIIRHDSRCKDGVFQKIPERLEVSQFLVANPNVQNSNLFLRAAKLVAIGGYNENLVSTTDRDTCIRLLQSNNVKYSILRNHLMHHDASEDHGRLSYPGSSQKKKGLETFYQTYAPLMTQYQKEMFKERAMLLFKVKIEEAV